LRDRSDARSRCSGYPVSGDRAEAIEPPESETPLFDTAAYLQRIGCAGRTEPTLATLRALHRAHHLTVPFENLDIHFGREIVLDEQRLFDKIVTRWRGGFCFELNGLYAALLRELGFRVTLLSAGVWDGARGAFGPEFDHLLLRVDLDEPWLADTGFGDAFLDPLRLTLDEQVDGERRYRLQPNGARLVLMELRPGEEWQPQYAFSLERRRLAEFAGMCHFHQTSPDTHFTQQRVVSRATPDGRITLSDDRLITTRHGRRDEQRLAGPDAIREALRLHFDIELAPSEVERAFRAQRSPVH
jgi:N-hydroxyarylamine O-acetyltransferase